MGRNDKDNPRDWLKWSAQFQSLARKKQWTDQQKAHNLVALVEGDIEAEFTVAAQVASDEANTFQEFFTDVGLLMVPHDYSEDLDNELWTMTKRRDEHVLKLSQRLKENVRMFAELPLDAEEVLEVQQCRYLKRGIPRAWQDKLSSAGVVYDTFSELVQYFSRLEKAKRQQSPRHKNRGSNSNARDKDHRGEKNTGHYSTKRRSKNSMKHGSGDDARPKNGTCCTFLKTALHSTSDCHTLKRREKDEHNLSRTKKKRYPRIHNDFAADSDSDSDSCSGEDEIKFVGLVEKKTRPKRASLRVLVKLSRGGPTFEVLLDSGASKSIIKGPTLDANVQLGRKLIAASPAVFETMNGSVTSSGTTMVQFVFPKLKADSVVTHRFEVIKDSSDAMVIGRDLISALGLILNFKGKVVQWDENQEVEGQDFPDESKEVADIAVEPEQLLTDHLEGRFAQHYLELLPYAVARSHESKARIKIQQLINTDVLE
ncbi:hypothetical protein PInf_009222 [Phytophthora infestans]|nr:hypothetical protein PInf_009222 [Phytophthora infestans]